MISYFLFTFIPFIIVKYTFCLHNPAFYMLDKNVSLNTNTLFNEFCQDKPSKDVVCIILKPDILNNLICYNKSCLMCINKPQKNSCYYSSFFTPKCSATILYPLIDTKSAIPITRYSETSLIQLGNKEKPDICTALIDEICRINRDFSQNLDSLLTGRKSNVLSLKFNSTKGADKNYIIQEFELSIPSRKTFFDYILTLITDNFYPHVSQYLKNVEKMLKFRECVLMNELDLVFYNITQFPLMTYKKIMTFKTYIISGFSYFAYIIYKKLGDIWNDIVESDLNNVISLIEKFLRVYNSYEVDLYSELRLIMDPSVYNDILTNSTSYCKQFESIKGKVSRIEKDKLITESNEFLRKINILLSKQCQPPSTYGPQCTVSFFKGLEGKYANV